MKNTNEQYLDDCGLKPYYYYLGTTTVCILVHDNKICARIYARGIAICSPKDQFVKSIGRAKALGRALQAYSHNSSLNPIKHSRFPERFLFLPILDFMEKSSFHPQPTTFEKNILKLS